MARRDARDVAMRLLYQWALTGESAGEMSEQEHALFDDIKLNQQDLLYISDVLREVTLRQEDIDGVIQTKSVRWTLARMPAVDLAVLRLAIYELLYRQDSPPKAIASEAANLAQRYGGEKSPEFVTGLLGQVIREHQLLSPERKSDA